MFIEAAAVRNAVNARPLTAVIPTDAELILVSIKFLTATPVAVTAAAAVLKPSYIRLATPATLTAAVANRVTITFLTEIAV